ncbi:MAG: CPBP family intramembrane metalloprotease [Clostridiales bacterium]|nr:CPBP family intramembrane metalloprotease [Clostridiales bacterium]
MKNILNFFKCLLPLIVGLGLQLVIGTAFSIFLTAQVSMQMSGASTAEIQAETLARYMQAAPLLILISHIVTIFVAYIWFYYASDKKRPGNPVKGFSFLTIPAMLLCMAGLQYTCSGLLMVLSNLAPDMLTGYVQLLESSGLNNLEPGTVIATVIFAPIGEELLFRGLTLSFAKKLTSKFWIANLLQATCFGIFHANIIQGIYAAIMGLVFGYVAEKYKSLYAAILLHALVNFCGTIISGLLLPDLDPGLGMSFAILCGAGVILATGLRFIQKDVKNI